MSGGRTDNSYDDGELTDESGRAKSPKRKPASSRRSSSTDSEPPPVKSNATSSKDKEAASKFDSDNEEERLRRNLLAKASRMNARHSENESDEQEMFTIQPGDSKSRLAGRVERPREDREKDRRDRDRDRERTDRERTRHKHDRKDRDRDRESREKDRSSQRERIRAPKYDDRRPTKISSSDDLREKDRQREKERQRDRERREERRRLDREKTRERKHKRSRSISSSPEAARKRDRKPFEKDRKTKSSSVIHVDEKSGGESSTRSKRDERKEEKKEQKMEVDDIEEKKDVSMESVEVVEKTEITSFVLDSPAGPKKYSKFDSSPEGDNYDRTPVLSDVELRHSTDDEVGSDMDFDPENVRIEDLTEEQKAMLSPDTKSRLEDDLQKRLIAQLPVFFPGILGCRNVQEYHCVNKVEEGTYGVVFRAKDKRTDEIVALKRLKMEKEREGFPITSLREINMLLKAGNHPNIVNVREVVVGSTLEKIFVVMDFVEHDLKNLMDVMKKRGKRFSIGEQKTLMLQLLSGLKHMHDLWILHRDLKSSNLLLSHKGILKIADFGLAREFGSPLKQYTSIVVTLWYRAPELLLGQKLYSTPIDMWSVGCLMAEFHLLKPLFPGKGEMDQISKIFLDLGTPTESIWAGYESLPLVRQASLPQHPNNQLRKKFPASLINQNGFKLLNELLIYDPEHRITAEQALAHPWFSEEPRPTPPEMFPTFPAKSEQHKAPPPPRKKEPTRDVVVDPNTARLLAEFNVKKDQINNFSLKFDPTKF